MRINTTITGSSTRAIPARQYGFTLIELMAVVLIIMVLVSLLSAALNHTKAKALRLACLENVRQLNASWHMYTDDNEQYFPLNQSAPGLKHHRLVGRRLSTNSWVAGNPREDRDTRNIERGSLFSYTRSTGIYRCPMDDSEVSNTGLPRTRSYSISAYLGGDHPEIDPRVKMKYDELLRPENVFVFIEEHESSIWDAGFIVAPREKTLLASVASDLSTPSDRHYQGCHLSFADGHVEYWKWYWPKTSPAANRLKSGAAREINDMRRLQACIPQP